MTASSRSPVATYRVQLRQGFGFDEAAELVDYLSDLGVSHVYLSPVLRAAPASTHGYDVTDPSRVDEALGGEAARQRFLQALERAGLEHMVDIVPNHMSVASDENLWWWDVLENGPTSVHASAFDVEWDGPTEEAKSKVLLPILSDHYGHALRAGKIALSREAQGFLVNAAGRKLPVSPTSLAPLLLAAAQRSESAELELLAHSLGTVAQEADPTRHAQQQEILKGQIAALLAERENVARELDRSLDELNASPDALDELLSRQFYRLAHYRLARYDLDYRRFFDIQDLAALSVHTPEVFERTHALVLGWIASGELSALRVDHPDGLRDPAGYFRRLRQQRDDVWIVAEKILEPGETLPEEWAVDGTTGYDFLNAAGGLFVDSQAEAALTQLYDEFLGDNPARPFESEVRAAKRLVLDDLLASDLWRVTRLLRRVCIAKPRQLDFANEELRRALREVIACLPVYRTYAQPSSLRRERDVNYVRAAVRAAGEEKQELDRALLGLLEELLCGGASNESEWEFVLRFQQLSAATMAKGLEDTAFYRYPRLISLNEVGGDPSLFGIKPEEFHDFCSQLQARWPLTLVAGTTHDTKRSEDARLRVSALSEFSDAWSMEVKRWSALARANLKDVGPDRMTEYLLWQTLIAAHPVSEQRLTTYLEKAMREAKLHTSWSSQNSVYEASVLNFARAVLANSEIMNSVGAFVEKLLPVAWRSSLSQTLLRLTACGVPDIYQGTELWDTRLTDPDNRGGVDFEARKAALERSTRASVEDALAAFESGIPKLWLIQRVLGLRRLKPEWFGPNAAYLPLHASGAEAASIISYRRGEQVVVVAPRLWGRLLSRGFGDTQLDLPQGIFRNLFESDARYAGRIELAQLLRRFPVALLIAESTP